MEETRLIYLIAYVVIGLAIFFGLMYFVIRAAVDPIIQNTKRTYRLIRLLLEKENIDKDKIEFEITRKD